MAERAIRLFSSEPLASDALIALDSAQTHYLRHVMRCRDGDVVRLFSPEHGEWRAVLEARGRQLLARPDELVRPPAAEPGPVLAIAVLKRPRLELTVEKATELGVTAIQPLVTAHAARDRINLERLAAIAREAAEQCERLTLPEIRPSAKLDAWLAARPAAAILYAALERAPAPPLDRAIAAHGPGDLLVGPEGGFSPAERARLGGGAACIPVRLGATVLRAETAAIVGLGMLALRRLP